jgi:hypothetical protein
MQVIVNILAEKGVRPPTTVKPEHLLVRMAESPQGGAILIVFNLHEQSVEATVRGLDGARQAADLVNRKKIGFRNGEMSLTVDGEGIRMFHIQD